MVDKSDVNQQSIALGQALEALEKLEKEYGSDHPELVNTLSRIGGLFWDSGQYGKSVAFGERALAIIERELGPEDSQVVTSAENLIAALIKIKRFSHAMNLRHRFFFFLPEDHPRYPYFKALEAYIVKESTRSGFRPPTAKKKKKKKRKR